MSHAIGDIMQARVIIKTDVDGAVNTMHYRVDAKTGDGATNAEIATVLFDAWKTFYASGMVDLATVERVEVSKIYPIPPDPMGWSTGAAVPGIWPSATDHPLPRMTCGMITKVTQFAGTRYRGRLYYPFTVESANGINGAPTIAFRAILQDLADEMKVGVTIVGAGGTTGINPIIYHRDDHTYNYITDMVARNYWGTQRRRNNDRFG